MNKGAIGIFNMFMIAIMIMSGRGITAFILTVTKTPIQSITGFTQIVYSFLTAMVSSMLIIYYLMALNYLEKRWKQKH